MQFAATKKGMSCTKTAREAKKAFPLFGSVLRTLLYTWLDMITMAKSRFGTILFLCLLSLTGIASQSSEEGCFENDDPTCQPPDTDETSQAIDAQQVCFVPDKKYLGKDDLNRTRHKKIFNEKIPAGSQLCQQTRMVYHKCYWCDLERSSWCINNAGIECDPPITRSDETVDVPSTCRDASKLLDAGQFAATIDLCFRFGQVLHQCRVCNRTAGQSRRRGRRAAGQKASDLSDRQLCMAVAFALIDVIIVYHYEV